MAATTTCVLLALLGAVWTASVPASPEYQRAVDQLASRLTVNQSIPGEGGVVLMPPTFSVDIWSLLRLAVHHELQQQQTTETTARQSRMENWPSTIYHRSQLNLVKLGGRDYFFSRHQKLTWIDAVSFCRLYGMALVSVETREEDMLIINHLQSLGLDGKLVVLTSGNKIGRSTYLWLNGAQLIYEHWKAGQPADPATEHCVVYWEREWHDWHCSVHEANFICEQE